MTIRRLTAADLEESAALSQFAFQYELSDAELAERKQREKPEHTWGYFKNNQLAAKMKIIPLEIFIHGKVFAMGGVASVATWPEHRRQGMVKQLLTHGLKEMKKNGQSVSLLHPFSFAYYRKYGWEHIFDRKEYTVKKEQFPRFNDIQGTMRRTQLNDDLQLLNEVYEQYARQFNGTLKRTDDWWRHHSALKDKKAIVAVYDDRNRTPKGYIAYKVKNNIMTIHELVHLDENARRGLWQFISHHDSMVNEVTLIAPADDGLSFILQEPRIDQHIQPYFMGRIVDVQTFLEQYPFHQCQAADDSVLHIEDPYAPWNHRPFHIRFDKQGRANVTPLERTNTNLGLAKQGIRCDIQTFSAMLLGYRRPSTLYDIGRLTGEADDVMNWERMIPERTPYFPDFF